MKVVKQITLINTCLFMVASFAYAGGNAATGEKLFNDPALGGSSNIKSCASCHPKGSGLEGTAAKFKKSGKSLDAMVNMCVTGPLGGKALAMDSGEMMDILSYIESLGGK